MCKGSQQVSSVMEAEANSVLGIGTVRTHEDPAQTIGAFHKQGETVATCVHCVQTGQKLTLSNIPAALQKLHGLHATEVATFVENAWHVDDQLVFDRNKLTLNLMELAHRKVNVLVGVRTPDIQAAVDSIIGASTTLPRELVTADGGTEI